MQTDLFSTKRTQKEIIIEVLRLAYPNYIPSHQLQKTDTVFGWIGTSGDRRCRELEEEGEIESKPDGKYISYRLKIKRKPRIM
jgi:hypothetical protein